MRRTSGPSPARPRAGQSGPSQRRGGAGACALLNRSAERPMPRRPAKMAERSGQGTSLRGMRERMVAAAHAIAEERRSQSGHSPLQLPQASTSNLKTACKPVLDGSVLKSDEKQRLAKERREKKRRIEDATKETQLFEKERKAKIYFEKQMEEKQRKIKEQKEKEEQRRISAEEKRKQKLEEEQERFRAVVSRTEERINSRAETIKKRWSWEGSMAEGRSAAESKDGKKNKRCSSLSRKCTQSHSTSDKEQLDEKPSGTGPRTVTQYMAKPNRSKSTHDLKSVAMLPSASLPAMGTPEDTDLTSTNKNTRISYKQSGGKASCKTRGVEPMMVNLQHAPLKATIQTLPCMGIELAPKVSQTALPVLEMGECSMANNDIASPADGMAICEADIIGTGTDSSPIESVDPSPEVSTGSSTELSVNPSPEVSVDSSELSADISPDVSEEVSPEMTSSLLEIPPSMNTEKIVKQMQSLCVENPNQSLEPDTEVVAGPSSDTKVVPQKLDMTPNSQKRTTSNIPCYTWQSSPSVAVSSRPSSPQIVKHQRCPPSLVMSKSSKKSSLAYTVTPVQHSASASNAINASEKKKDKTFKIHKYEGGIPRLVIAELSNKMTAGIVNKEEATKILAEKRRLVREQREKEKLQENPMEERKEKDQENHREDVLSKADEAPPQTSDDHEFQNATGGQQDPEGHELVSQDQEQEPDTTKRNSDQDDQKVVLTQKGDAKIKAQEEADRRKKEHERIMLQNLKERLERKKVLSLLSLSLSLRIEEIMKRTRKADWNPSKTAETLGKAEDADDEDEADDEEESDSDKELSDTQSSASLSSEESSSKPKVCSRKTKLVYLDPTSTFLRPGKKVILDCGMTTIQPVNSKGTVTLTKDARSLSKRTTARSPKSKTSLEANKSLASTPGFQSQGQEWNHSTIIDASNGAEPLPSPHTDPNKKFYRKGSLTHGQGLPAGEKSPVQSDQ
ncbi:MAP7 domain-containing protein 3 [Suncus etruscus]|uniref:MAP7 domain-containing protein 3 n=1 Tax=Suncus etruscus TaxID=109475 RepID=UPI00210F7937|nr:MAP7 domain-containing protein 3 [Suncus etruscus]